ncbi:hypothetical protein [Methylobacterium indicum]|uniref:Uncharacterized protein n=1 Tax=Methylobacterium indicum TaxID=1775910 RepID=A0A8H9CAJ2_9HYPH|nr:hypothetical protein [Methylobacterium indicum]BCM87871.1 hypothetical protein mvi_63320 [Methylobacterium indicum]
MTDDELKSRAHQFVVWQSNNDWDQETVAHDAKYLTELLKIVRDTSFNEGIEAAASIFKDPIERLEKRLKPFQPDDHHPDQPAYDALNKFKDQILSLKRHLVPMQRLLKSP